MVEKVLTIDLSYIMAPTIQQYEDWVHSKWSSETQQWDMMGKKLGWHPTACQRRIDYLLRILRRTLPNLNNREQVVFVRHHNDILDYLDSENPIKLDNVDHCHDIYYSGHNSPDIVCENNWVWWLDRMGRLSQYRWFSNRNSIKYDSYMPLTCQFSYVDDRRRFPMPKPDLVVICESPFWVPPEERSLFRIMRREVDSYFQGAECNENTKTVDY